MNPCNIGLPHDREKTPFLYSVFTLVQEYFERKKLSVCSPSCGMKERQHSIIEGDIRFSHEELVKVISITDYLVAKLRARAITRRTDEQCTTVSPSAD